MDCPEYKTLRKCYPDLVNCVEQSPADIVTQLKPIGILAPSDESFLDNSSNSRTDKARRIVDVLVHHVKSNKEEYFKVLKVMKDSGDWTKATVRRVEETYKSLSEDTQQGLPSEKIRSKLLIITQNYTVHYCDQYLFSYKNLFASVQEQYTEARQIL